MPPNAEKLRPKDVFSPKLQRTYQCIQHRARAVISEGEAHSSNLPEPDPRITGALTIDGALLEQACEVNVGGHFVTQAGRRGEGGRKQTGQGESEVAGWWYLMTAPTFDTVQAIDAFAALCPLESAATAGSGSKRSRATGSGPAEAAAAAESKKPKLFDDDDANAFGAAGDLLQIGHNPNLIPTSIRSDQPVQDFWAMVGNGERDLTDTAMLQMGEMIPRLLNEARAHHRDLSARVCTQPAMCRMILRAISPACCAAQLCGPAPGMLPLTALHMRPSGGMDAGDRGLRPASCKGDGMSSRDAGRSNARGCSREVQRDLAQAAAALPRRPERPRFHLGSPPLSRQPS